MIDHHADVAIVGSGFGGSLSALILKKLGFHPLLVDRAVHPRFALGESSTPIANAVLLSLARRYDLPRIAPFAEWGTWRKTYPEIPCGLKRGFTYVGHETGRPFAPRGDHSNELLVAASHGDADADTHWLRADFDAFLVREAQGAGIPFFDRTEITELRGGEPWTLIGHRAGEPVRITADFLIDASGEGNFLARQLGISTAPDSLRTNARTLYGHFTGVRRWQMIFERLGGNTADHVYSCDDAALHHVIDAGWMWVLPFNNGVTSAGFMLDTRRYPFDPQIAPEAEWRQIMERYPSVGEQFAKIELTAACGSFRRTPRLQRRAARVVGPNWAMLPLTAYALDALHSTGNAHTLVGIERLVRIFERRLARDELYAALQEHARLLQSEIDVVDEIVHGCYLAFSRFELFASFALWYFAAATVSEGARRAGQNKPGDGFLLAHDAAFRRALRATSERLESLVTSGRTSDADVREFEKLMRTAIAPWNIAGLCDPAKKNMYPFAG